MSGPRKPGNPEIVSDVFTTVEGPDFVDLEGPRPKTLRSRLLVLAISVALLALWELASYVGIFHRLIVPSPSSIIGEFPSVLTADYFLPNLRVTLFEIVVGFSLAVTSALTLALITVRWEPARSVIQPFVIAVQSVPKIVFTPIFITWFGFGPSSKIVNAAVIAFFPLFINTTTGLLQGDRDSVLLLRSMTASERQMFLKLSLPRALPMILAGLKVCWTLSVVGVIVAEFVGAEAGVGYIIQLFNFRLEIARVFVMIIVISAFTVIIYNIIEMVEHRVCFWAYQGTQRAGP